MTTPQTALKTTFHLKELEKEYGFAQAVRVGDTLYISGTVALDEQGNALAIDDMAGQIRHIYTDLIKTLHAHGLTLEHVVKEAIFTTDMDAFLAAMPVRAEYYRGLPLPASAAWIQVVRLANPHFLVEIEAIAAFPPTNA